MKRSTPVEREKQEPVVRDIIHDPLTDLIRQGARRIVFEALNAEIEDIVGMYRDRRMPDGSPSVANREGSQVSQTNILPFMFKKSLAL